MPYGRIWKLAIALILLAALYFAADWRDVRRAMAALNGRYVVLAMLLFIPQTLVSALRWQGLAAGLCRISLAQALRQTLIGSAYNLVVPSKLGDLSKAAMLPLPLGQKAAASWRVIVEKLADVAALAGLLAWGLCGLGLLPLSLCIGGLAIVALASRPIGSGRFAGPLAGGAALAASSIGLWALHLWQIDLFLKSAGVFVTWPEMLARVPAAIFAGLLPVSLWGMGTRDGALVYLFQGIASPATMAVVGLLTALRYLVPGAVGIPLAAGMGGARRSTADKITIEANSCELAGQAT